MALYFYSGAPAVMMQLLLKIHYHRYLIDLLYVCIGVIWADLQ